MMGQYRKYCDQHSMKCCHKQTTSNYWTTTLHVNVINVTAYSWILKTFLVPSVCSQCSQLSLTTLPRDVNKKSDVWPSTLTNNDWERQKNIYFFVIKNKEFTSDAREPAMPLYPSDSPVTSTTLPIILLTHNQHAHARTTAHLQTSKHT